jgi:hypothetical protein
MNRRRPPRLAIWLLKSLGFIRRNPALIGDLLEEFRNGRSEAWYWRQTANLIFTWIRWNGTRYLPGLAILFVLLGGIDFVFWRIGRRAPLPWWTCLISEALLIGVSFWTRTWRERRGLGVLLLLVLFLLWWSQVAWTLQDSLWGRLGRDLFIVTGIWAWGAVREMRKSRGRRS